MLGETEGLGVGLEITYVGLNVGEAVGVTLGAAVGLGVGAP